MKIVFIVLAIVIVLALIAFFSYKLYCSFAADSILKGSRKNKHFLYLLLKTRFGSRYLLPDISLLGGGRDSTARYYVKSELLYLNSGGLFVIRSVPGNGLVDVTQNDTWYRICNDRSFPFTNPFEQNEVFIRLLKSLFRYANIPNVPIYNIVVFTGNRVKFNQRQNGLLTANGLIPYMCDMKKNHFLSLPEQERILKTLKEHGKFLEKQSGRA
ncbi:MAG: NERD domain-containing protein [Ruminococcaceae bacterium]|nr:NERD domain-containing protein [Oscillospiraceae bacterium]